MLKSLLMMSKRVQPETAEGERLDERVAVGDGRVEAQRPLGAGAQQHGVRIQPRRRQPVGRADVGRLEAQQAAGAPAETEIPRAAALAARRAAAPVKLITPPPSSTVVPYPEGGPLVLLTSGAGS
jgi:hypothetical protein